mmetsp:Transcript_9173/g.17491  ORF Transcript_9173/g.17491 Transcript_9173/m.17491 type:complete len:241 (-) Transcript_9173:49-771(-)|eukprot:scaffold4510_cov183-Amphora_coffeaeformis.AAC.29
MSANDFTWREYNIHGEEKEEEESFGLFTSEVQLEDFDYAFAPVVNKRISLRGYADYSNSTGMTIWKGSEVLAHYLSSHPECVRGKRVLEMGAGLGLCGLLTHHLGASHVCLTDGDIKVLDQLRHNVTRNTTTQGAMTIECPQLVWGKDNGLEAFLQKYGTQDVILAADCLYIPQSVEPFFQTVQRLLAPNGVLLSCHMCSSQAPRKLVESMVTQYGFVSSAQAVRDAGRIELFRRKDSLR